MRLIATVCSAAVLVLLPIFQTAADPGPVAVSVSINPADVGVDIPDDCSGLSFEMSAVSPNTDGIRLFRDDNQPLISLFKTLGVHSLRLGGGSADTRSLPSNDDFDHALAFARAVDARVICVLPMRSVGEGIRIARHLSEGNSPDVDCFSVGNEPTMFRTDYAAHIAYVKDYIAAVTAADAVPDAMFCGCSTTPAFGTQWSAQFANDLAPGGQLKFIGQHFFPGGDSHAVKDPGSGRETLLDPNIEGTYQDLYDSFVPAVQKNHLTFRLDETNSFYFGGCKNVSDTHAAGLWALDYMHWWAAHGAIGVNFHTGDTASHTLFGKPSPYAVFWSIPNGCDVHPLGYAMKAFDLGGHGYTLPVKVRCDDEMPNLRTYATLASDGTLHVTLINREHGPDGKSITVTIDTQNNAYKHAEMITMTAPGNNIAATTGVTLGGAAIESDGTWTGKWEPLPPPNADGTITAILAPATAAVMSLTK